MVQILDRFPLKLIYYQNKKESKHNQLKLYFDKEQERIVLIDGDIYNINEINRKSLNNNHSLRKEDQFLKGVLNKYMNNDFNVLKDLISNFNGVLFSGRDLIGFVDPIGTKPLYFCETKEVMVFSSEMNVLFPLKKKIKSIPPGYNISSSGNKSRYYQFPQFIENYKLNSNLVKRLTKHLNILIKKVVKEYININERIGVLLTGGIDSTIICHVVKNIVENIHVYTIGTEEKTQNLFYATKYANSHNLRHTKIEVEEEDILSIIPNIIHTLESFEVPLVRRAIPLFLLCKQIREENNIDLLLIEGGGDILFGGIDHFTNFKSHEKFNKELFNLLEGKYIKELHGVNSISNFFSIKIKIPLIDKRIIEFSFKIPIELKILKKEGVGIAKKWILRKAFETEISEEYIWRKKKTHPNVEEYLDKLFNYMEKIISDDEFEEKKNITPSFSLNSKEELYYWRIFNLKFHPALETINELGFNKVYPF